MQQECYICHIRTVEKLIEKFQPEKKIADLFSRSIIDLLHKKEHVDNPLLATDIHRLAKNILNHNDLYITEKTSANKLLLDNYAFWQNMVVESSNPFLTASKLAVAGNIIDYGANSVPEDIEKRILDLASGNLTIDKTNELSEAIGQADSILYLGDNAGEIVFDKLFIETMQHSNVCYAVRGKPVINDVSFEDVEQIQLDKVCRVISNGYDAPSTLLEYCSEEFLYEFRNADLIISKGQGNFEGLMNSENENIFFMLMAKCNPMADLLGVSKGSMLVSSLHNKVHAL